MPAAILIPWYKSKLTTDEEISLQHLLHFLDSYDKFLVTPRSLRPPSHLPQFHVKQFHDRFFGSVDAYSRLLLEESFYKAFREYEYILIYQLDSLVFSQSLEEWCARGFDYIGAPWFKLKNEPVSGFSRAGNGGFSLRKVDSFLKVIGSRRYIDDTVLLWKELLFTELKDIRIKFHGVKHLKHKLSVLRSVRRGARAYMGVYSLNEDHFWSDRARLFYPDFNVAPVEAALQFAFETAPRYCFQQNSFQLPFGCHAWAKWDREFWEPYLLS